MARRQHALRAATFALLAGLAVPLAAQQGGAAAPADSGTVSTSGTEAASQTPSPVAVPARPLPRPDDLGPATVSDLPATVPAANAPSSMTLDQPALPAAGAARTTLVLTRPGWVTIRARSAVGVALRLVSPAAGAGPWSGQAGEADGRLDGALDAGRYRIETRGPDSARGTVRLDAVYAVERNAEPVPLADMTSVSTTLVDGEQRSFALDVRPGETLVLEAAGRALGALRLWRDATWLEPMQPDWSVEDVAEGHPLRFARLATRLPPGRYRLVAYGGEPLDHAGAPGADATDTSELHLRRGVPELPRVWRADHVASPFGVDRYRIRRQSTRVRLELPLPDHATLTAKAWSATQVFAGDGNRATIEPRQGEAVAEVALSGGGDLGAAWKRGYDLVTVRRAAGQPYTLQAWTPTPRVRLTGGGRFRVETVIPGPARDALGASAMVFVGDRGSAPHPLSEADVIGLDRFSHWRGRFNLARKAELFLRVDEGGRFRFAGSGSPAVYGLTPYGRPKSGRWTVRRPDGDGFLLLKPGYYRFMLEPDAEGIHSFSITGGQPDAEPRPLPVVATFAEVALGRKQEAVVQLPRAMASDIGVAVRRLPLDLREAVALTLVPGAPQTLPVRAHGDGELRVRSPSGVAGVALRRVGGVYGPALRLERGRHRVDVRYEGRAPVQVMLEWQADVRPARPVVNDARLLLPGEPQRFSIAHGARRDFVLEVPESGFYAVETTGLLALSARLDAPSLPGLWATQTGGGGGRNARLSGWLDAGHYRLGVTALGRSAGEAGVRFAALAQASGGLLRADARVAFPMVREAVLTVPVSVAEAGRYRLAAMGIGSRYAVRLLDDEGWPVVAPRSPGEHVVDIASGDYTLQVLPGATDGAMVASLATVPAPVARAGHGPHALPLGAVVGHRFEREADRDGEDRWTFRLSAPAEVAVSATGGMVGVLERVGDQVVQVATLAANRPVRTDLTEGDYRLRLHHGDDANRVDYTVSVRPDALLPGERTTVPVPGTLTVRAGPGERVRLRSGGDIDVRAVLLDEEGNEVASADDAGADWNFDLTSPTGQGPWTLRLFPVGDASGRVSVTARAVAVSEPELADDPMPEPVRSEPLTSVTPLGLYGADAPVTVPLASAPRPGVAWFDNPGARPELVSSTYAGAHWPGRAVIAWAMPPATLRAQLEPGAPVRGVVERRDLPSVALQARGFGRHGVAVPAGRTRPLFLPAGHKRLVIDLPAGVLASVDGNTLAHHGPERFTVFTRVRRVFLLNTTGTDVDVGLRVRPAAADGGEPDGPGHLTFPSAGTLVLPTLPADGAVVGAVLGERFLHPDSALVAPGRVVRHGAGTVAWWDPLHGPGEVDSEADLPVATPDAGGRLRLATLHRLPATDADEPRFVRLVADRPMLVLGGDGPHLLARAVPRVVLMAPGEQWGVAPLDGAGWLQVDPLVPATLEEGAQGATQWAGPGESVVWRFELNEPGVIGLGLRGADDAAVQLQDAAGSVWGEGVNQRIELPPGPYWLSARSPVHAAPRAITAVLVGVTRPPSTAPPGSVAARVGGSATPSTEEARQ